jgi:hypothetical protein
MQAFGTIAFNIIRYKQLDEFNTKNRICLLIHIAGVGVDEKSSIL